MFTCVAFSKTTHFTFICFLIRISYLQGNDCTAFIQFLLMLQKLFYLTFFACFLLAKNDKTPPDTLQQLVQRFYSFYSQYPQQKLYVQTDRPYYLAGDDLYGKIYLVNETAGVAPD